MSLFQQNGFPTPEGEQKLKSLQWELKKLFHSDDAKNLNETQMRLLGSWICKMVGDLVADTLRDRVVKIANREDRFKAVMKYHDRIVRGEERD